MEPQHTIPGLKEQTASSTRESLEARLSCLADAGPEAIEDRIAELDREWTAGRMTKVTLGFVLVVGFALALVNPWWLLIPAIAGLIMLQYLFAKTSLIGHLFRSLGYRTGFEIDQEKMALKTLRGDFRNLPTVDDIENRDDIARLEGEGGVVVDTETSAKVDPKDAAKEAVEAARN